MQAIKLELQAFGPFAHKEVIDFTQFTDSKLFMISGKTGSGKSTIFDAICFALFGATSIDGRNLSQLVSDFSDPSTSSYVDFTWSSHQHEYRVVRHPSQLREKKRGTGYVEESMQASLYCDGELLGTRIKEVNQKVIEIIGLNLNQFRQISLLAQGEFKKLLLADSKERESIFRKIFNTEHLLEIQQRYKDKSIQLKSDIHDVQNKISTLMAQVITEEEYVTIERTNELFAAKIFDYSTRKTEITNNIAQIQKELQEVSKKTEINKQYLETKNQIDNLNNELKKLEENKNNIAEKQKYLDAAKTLKPYESTFNEIKKLNEQMAELENVKNQIVNKEEQISALKLKQANVNFDELKELYDTNKKRLIELQIELDTNTLNLPKLEQGAKLNEQLQQLTLEEKKQNEKLNALNNELSSIAYDESALLKYQTELLKLESHSETLKNKAQLKTELLTCRTKQSKFEAELKEISIKSIQAENDLLKAENIYYSKLSSLLAAKLNDGEMCPVCGSIEHPKLAKPSDGEVDEETIERLRVSYQNLFKEQQIKLSELSSIKKQIAEIAEKIDIELDYQQSLETNNQQIIDIKEQIINTENLIKQIDNLKQAIKLETHKHNELIQEISKCKEIISELNVHGLELAELKKAIAASTSIIKQLKQEVEQQENLINEYNKRETELVSLSASISTQKMDNNNAIQSCKAELLSKEATVKEIWTKLKIDELEAKEILAFDISNLTSEIVQYQTDYSNTKKLQTEANEKLNTLIPLLDINSEKAFEELSLQLDEENQKLGIMQTECNNTEKILNDIQTLYKNNEVKMKEYQNLNKINMMLNGRNRPYVSFERYILNAYFKQIVKFGNIRLQKMTNNRYKFNVNSQFKSGQTGQGLDLTIIDYYSGKERDITSLSGGESFKASISLALGLSDVVRFENGGIELNSLFIDEGFGTLDAESLDQAVEVIMDLEEDGRMVGIISHVSELKAMIKQQVQIETTKAGSTLKIKI